MSLNFSIFIKKKIENYYIMFIFITNKMSNSKKINIDAIKALTRTSRDEKNKNKYVDAAEEAKKHILENFEEKIETSAANGLFYADIYSWEYVENKHNKTKYCFNNVRISDILFKPPTDLEGKILDKPLRKKLETYFINLGFKFSIYSWRDSPSRKKSIRISWYDKQRSYRPEPYERRSPHRHSEEYTSANSQGYASANPRGYARDNSQGYARANPQGYASANPYRNAADDGYRYPSNGYGRTNGFSRSFSTGHSRQQSDVETHRDDRLADLDDTMADRCEDGTDYFQSQQSQIDDTPHDEPHNQSQPSPIETHKDDQKADSLDVMENEDMMEKMDDPGQHESDYQPSQC